MAVVKRKLVSEDAASVAPSKRPKSEHAVKQKSSKKERDAVTETSGSPKSAHRPSLVTVLAKEQPAFPRGGAGLLTPLERKQIHAKASRDAAKEFGRSQDLFGANLGEVGDSSDEGFQAEELDTSTKPKKTQKQKRSKVAPNKEASARIGGLSHKRIAEGSLILGRITSVNPRELAVAIPNGLVGYVPLTAISSQLSSKIQQMLEKDGADDAVSDHDEVEQDALLSNYFTPGQYLRVAVTSTGTDVTATKPQVRKRLELSIEPKLANEDLSQSSLASGVAVQVAVSSIEDHGLIVDLGFGDENAHGFIQKKALPPGRSLADFKTGAVLLCYVLSVGSNGKIVKLSADMSKSPVLKIAPSINAFLPGTVAEILLTEITDAGLAGKIMGMVDATADVVHSESFKDRAAFHGRYVVGKKIKGRLTCTYPLSDDKKLGFSMLEHIRDFPAESSEDSAFDRSMISSTATATVISVEPGLGVYMELESGKFGFAHISRLADRKVESISESSGSFKSGSQHKARVLDYNPVDGLYTLSLQQSVLDQPYLRVEDVPVGQVVKCSIEKLLVCSSGVSGLIVKLAEGVTGLIPGAHMSDVVLQHPEKKFREGTAVTARVLSTDPAKRQIKLTLKKTLVNSDQKLWTDYDQIAVADSTVGTLVKVDPRGAVVQFYGSVKGFLPVSEMSEAYIKDATEHFRVGQVVTVNAISVDPTKHRLTVSCREFSATNTSLENVLASLSPGTLATGTVFEKSQDDILMRLDGSDVIARLSIDHMSDGSLRKRQSTFNKIHVGQKMENVLVLDVKAKRRLVVMSNKQSLIKAAQNGSFVKSYDDIYSGALVTGFVSNITPDGIFVSFASGITGLITKRQVSEEVENEDAFGMSKFQTVTARITSVDYKGATPRFWLTMRETPAVDDVPGGITPKSALSLPTLSDAVDDSLNNVKDLSVGRLTKARIVSVKETQINVELAKDIQGRVDVSEIFESWEEIKDRKRPLRHFSPSQVVSVKVLGAHDTRNHRFLPLTHRSGKTTVYELTMKPTSLSTQNLASITLENMPVGSSWLAFVNNIAEDCLWVNISPTIRGRIRAMDVSDDLSLAADLSANFPIGSVLRVRVLSIDVDKNRLDLSARTGSLSNSMTIKDLSSGLILPARVTKVTDRNLLVQLNDNLVGAVDLIDLADDYSEANTAKYQKNDVVRVSIVRVDVANKKVSLSLRPSKVLSSSMKATDPEIDAIDQIKVNDIYRGFVANVGDKGIFITLGQGITAFVRVSNLSDAYLKDWKDSFQRDQLVKGKIVSVDKASGHVQMSLKESVMNANYKPPTSFNDLLVGDIVTGKVAKVETFGVFVLVDNSQNVRGLCHRSEMAEQRIEDASKLFNEGDVVKAKVLKIDTANRKINFGMKASYFVNLAENRVGSIAEEEQEDKADSDDNDETNLGSGALLDDDVVMREEATSRAKARNNADEEAIGQEDDEEDDQQSDFGSDSHSEGVGKDPDVTAISGGLNVNGFDWYGLSEPTTGKRRSGNTSDTDDEGSTPKLKKKKRAEIHIDQTGDLDANGPQSVDDYERLLLGEPDSSLLWLQYMAFHLELGDVDQARQIGERALQSIGLGQDAEKLNVWVAMLNLENAYGDDESVEAMFKRACEYNDAKEIYARLTSIYIQSGKQDKADELFQRMIKKFAQDPKVWLNYATFLFDKVGEADKARALLPQALRTLPKFTQFDLTSKFAQLEFKSSAGLAERGRTIFEGLISSFPKRVDLFNVLLDLEVKLDDHEQIRALFERIFSVKLKPKQAKYFFKRWLAWEEGQGDERRIDEVKARAAAWIRTSGKDT